MTANPKIVYVGCRANVNRSFIVAQLLQKYIGETSLPVLVTSGGVQVNERARNMAYYSGQLPQFVRALQRLGLDSIIPNISKHQSHAFTGPELQKADLIITMTGRQRDYLQQYTPPLTQVLMLSQLADLNRQEDVFDAMEASDSSFEAFVFEMAQLQYYLDFEAFKRRLGLP